MTRAYLRAEFRRALTAPLFLLSLLICLAIYAVGEGYIGWVNVILYPRGSWIDEHACFMMEMNPFRSLLPFPAALAAGHMLVDDWRHRNHCFQISRSSFAGFCAVKFIVPCVVGGAMLFIGLAGYLGLMACFIPAADEGTNYDPFLEELIQNRRWALYPPFFGSCSFCWARSAPRSAASWRR